MTGSSALPVAPPDGDLGIDSDDSEGWVIRSTSGPKQQSSFTEEEMNQLEAARFLALKRMPYLGSALFAVPWIRAEWMEQPTVAVDDQWRMYVHPEFLEQYRTGDEGRHFLATAMVHEMMHLLRDHAGRGKKMHLNGVNNHKAWNYCGDAEINDDIGACISPSGQIGNDSNNWATWSTFEPVLPSNLLADRPLPEELTAEEYWAELPVETKNSDGSGDDEGEEGKGDGQGGGEGSGSGDGGDGEGGDGNSEGDGEDGEGGNGSEGAEGDGGNGRGKGWRKGLGVPKDAKSCGSGASGVKEDWEYDSSEGPKGVEEAEQEIHRYHTATQVQDHERQHGIGSVPSGMSVWAKRQLEPAKVNWRKQMRTTIMKEAHQRKGADEFTYSRPSTRSTSTVLRPSMIRQSPRIAVVVDTSGSMGTTDLGEALSEIKGISKSLNVQGPDLQVLSADAHVHTIESVRSASAVASLDLRGGGGTDMRVGITAAQNLRPPPHVIVLLTDGGTPMPDKPVPGLITCIVGGHSDNMMPDWAKVINIHDLEK